MIDRRRLMLTAVAVGALPLPVLAEGEALAFPGALGWAASTPGGRGGRIIRVTTLADEGPGSLRAALEAEGPRIVVFEVGGVIVNDVPTWRTDAMPYGGVKDSGLGREGLRWSIEDMTEPRLLAFARTPGSQ